jgi:hypothetical protein
LKEQLNHHPRGGQLLWIEESLKELSGKFQVLLIREPWLIRDE